MCTAAARLVDERTLRKVDGPHSTKEHRHAGTRLHRGRTTRFRPRGRARLDTRHDAPGAPLVSRRPRSGALADRLTAGRLPGVSHVTSTDLRNGPVSSYPGSRVRLVTRQSRIAFR